jgi:hypothetical protein
MKFRQITILASLVALLGACSKTETQLTNQITQTPNKNTRAGIVYGVRPDGAGNTELVIVNYPNVNSAGAIKFANGLGAVPNIRGIAHNAGKGYVIYRTANNTNWRIAEFPINNPGSATLYCTLTNSSTKTDLCDIELENNTFIILDRTNANSGVFRTGKVPFGVSNYTVPWSNVGPPVNPPNVPIQNLAGICTWGGNYLILANDCNVFVRLAPNTLANQAITNIPYASTSQNYSWAYSGNVGGNSDIIITRGNQLTYVTWFNLVTGTGAVTVTYPTPTGEIFDLARL